MPRSTRKKSPTGICHVLQGKESKPVPPILLSFKLVAIRFLFVLTFVLQFISLRGQTFNMVDRARYNCAYNFIKNNSTSKRIKISRCIVDLDRWVFPVDSLADFPEEKRALMDFVEQKKIKRNKDYISDEVAAQTFGVKRFQKVLYFSHVENNMLAACLLPFDKRRHRKKDIDVFDIICRYNESENYLFIFDENSKIRKVIKVFVNYD